MDMAEEKKKQSLKSLEERIEKIDERLKRVEKVSHSLLRHPLLVVCVSAVLGFLLSIGYNCIINHKPKPNKTRCAIVYLENDALAKSDADIVKQVLDSRLRDQLREYTVLPQDSVWYWKKIGEYYKLPDSTDNNVRDTTANSTLAGIGYNDSINAVSASRVHTYLHKVFCLDSSSHKGVHFYDVLQPDLLPKDSWSRRYAVVVVIPPYSWRKWVENGHFNEH